MRALINVHIRLNFWKSKQKFQTFFHTNFFCDFKNLDIQTFMSDFYLISQIFTSVSRFIWTWVIAENMSTTYFEVSIPWKKNQLSGTFLNRRIDFRMPIHDNCGLSAWEIFNRYHKLNHFNRSLYRNHRFRRIPLNYFSFFFTGTIVKIVTI